MIRIDLKKDDYEKIKPFISEPDGRIASSCFKVTEEQEKFEMVFNSYPEATAFLEILDEMKIKILKKRIF